MLKKSFLRLPLLCAICIIEMSGACFAQTIKIKNDLQGKKIVFGNGKIKMAFDYDQKANISLLVVNGQKVIEGAPGIYSEIRTKDATYSTLHLSSDPVLKVTNDTIIITGIIYGNKELVIKEN